MPKRRSRANGEGTVYRRVRNGKARWYAELVVGWNENGRKEVLRSPGFDKKEQASGWLAERVAERNKGVLAEPNRLTVGQFLEEWMDQVVAHQCKPTTQRTYKWIVETHLKKALGHIQLSKLSPGHVEAMYHERLAAGLAPRTVHHLHMVLHKALDRAVRHGLVPTNVCDRVERPRVRKQEMQVLTPDQGRRFLQEARQDRLHALFTIALTMGLRLGELLGLRWQDVDLEDGTLTVAQTVSDLSTRLIFSTPKSAKSRRILPMPALAVEALRRWRVEQARERLLAGEAWEYPELVFTTRIGTIVPPTHVRRRLRHLLQAAGCPRIRFHDLRHTALTAMATLMSAREVQEYGGHADVSTTLGTYTHVWEEQKKAAAERIDAFWTADQRKAT